MSVQMHAANFQAWVDTYIGYAWNTWDREDQRCEEYLNWDALPFSTIWSPIIGCLVYCIGVAVIPRIMRNRQPFNLEKPLILHNAILTLGSLGMFIGLIRSLWVTAANSPHGWRTLYNDPAWEMPCSSITLWCYIFYASKYYELLDTLFLALRKKPIRAVQVWHHSTVMLLFWSYMHARMMSHWFLMFANTFVHIFVYGYFLFTSLKLPTPWKSSVTRLQLGQFVADMLYAVPFLYYNWNGTASGDWAPWFIGQFIGATFIVLFYRVYKEIQRKKRLRKLAKSA